MTERPNPYTSHVIDIDRQLDGDYLLIVYSLTENDLRIMDGLPKRIPGNATIAEFGAAVVVSLALCRIGLPPYFRGDDLMGPFLSFVGAKSEATYKRGIRSVGVTANYVDQIDEIRVTPFANQGSRAGFTPIMEHRKVFPFQSPEQLGRAVLDAFEYAT
jgi:hypothetical protein